jgi:hypothetical protein
MVMKKEKEATAPIPFPNSASRMPLDEILISGNDVKIDEELADRILKSCIYQGQRPLNEDRALLLGDTMERGTFLPHTQLAFGRWNGNFFLVNGQHRLTAVTLSRQAQYFRIEVYECASSDEIDSLYARFDQPGGQRSLTQISRSLGLHDDEKDGLRPASAALLLRAVPLLMIDLKRIVPSQRPRNSRDLDAKREFALCWKPWAIDYQNCLDGGIPVRTARFRASGTMAIALATLRYQNARAKEFWREAAHNSGLKSGDPRHTLHTFFLQSKRVRSEFDLAEACSFAWNAWFSDRPLTLLKILGGKINVRGTPFNE